jgi:NAD(P)H-dependent FMN reductase
MNDSTDVLLISGSGRTGSTNVAALRTAAAVAEAGVVARLFDGLDALPLFNPDDDREGADVNPRVAAMREAVAGCDAILICTPEYAGALPAALKNLLEWTIGDAGTYERAVGWINVSGPAAPTGGADAHASLRKVLEYAGADIVEAACRRVPLTRDAIGASGLVEDPTARAEIAAALRELVAHARAAARERAGT